MSLKKLYRFFSIESIIKDMKRFIIISIIQFYFTGLFYTQNFSFARQMGGPGIEQALGIALDASGNVYTTGYYQQYGDYDPGPATYTIPAPPSGLPDIFVSKLDAAGNFVWLRTMGGTNIDEARTITTDATGNVYIAGYFYGTADFDPGSSTFNLTSPGMGYDAFICKLDPSGNFLWAKRFGGIDGDMANSISVDISGHVLATGTFSGTVDFDPGPGSFNLSSSSGAAFITKLDANGNFIWAKNFGGLGVTISPASIKSDASGNVITTGMYDGLAADFDPGISTYTLSTNGLLDVFISKLDVSGNFLWAVSFGSSNNDSGDDIATDSGNNIYATGSFSSSVDFDPSSSVFALTSNGLSDIFVCKLDANGNLVYAKNMGGTSAENPNAITVDATSNVYTSGSFLSTTADFDPGPGTFTLGNTSSTQDIFVSKLDASGNFSWAQRIGSIYHEDAADIQVDATGSVFTTGVFSSMLDFDPGVPSYTLQASGYNVFVSKLATCMLPSSPTDGTPGSNLSICPGISTSLLATGSGTINWYASPTATPAIITGTVFNTPTLSPGSYIYYTDASNSCGFSPLRTSITITVHAPPTLTISSFYTTVCQGGTVNLNAGGGTTYTWSTGSNNTSISVSPSVTSTYSIIGTSVQGCTNTAALTLTVLPLPVINISSTNTLICEGDSSTLTASGGVNYFWDTGSFSSSIVVAPTVTTTYSLSASDGNCINTASFTQSVSACIGINEHLNTDIPPKLFPNPNNGTFYVESHFEGGHQKLIILNSVGQEVYEQELRHGNNVVNLYNLSAGLYYYQIDSGGKQQGLGKLIIL
jgi:hypothetical protein